jgi:hypothetical protein
VKKAVFILAVLAISCSAVAQEGKNVKRNDLKGPAYKNYQVWMDKSEPVKVYSQITKQSLQGPAYKNYQSLGNTPKENLAIVNIGGGERQKLTGPEYKNYGPWSKKVK